MRVILFQCLQRIKLFPQEFGAYQQYLRRVGRYYLHQALALSTFGENPYIAVICYGTSQAAQRQRLIIREDDFNHIHGFISIFRTGQCAQM